MTKRKEGANPHASALASIASEKRTAAARANLAAAHAARRANVVCTCHLRGAEGIHAARCAMEVNRKRRERYAERLKLI